MNDIKEQTYFCFIFRIPKSNLYMNSPRIKPEKKRVVLVKKYCIPQEIY